MTSRLQGVCYIALLQPLPRFTNELKGFLKVLLVKLSQEGFFQYTDTSEGLLASLFGHSVPISLMLHLFPKKRVPNKSLNEFVGEGGEGRWNLLAIPVEIKVSPFL